MLEKFIPSNSEQKHSHAELITLSNVIGDGIVVADLDGKIIHVNSSLCETTGFDQAEILEKGIDFLVNSRDFKKFRDHVTASNSQLRLGNSIDDAVTVVVGKSGREIPVEVEIVGFQLDEQPRTLFSIKDLTDRVTMENFLLKQIDERESLSEIAAAVNRYLDLDDIFRTAAKGLRQIVQYDRLVITLVDSNRNQVRIAYVDGVAVPNMEVGTVLSPAVLDSQIPRGPGEEIVIKESDRLPEGMEQHVSRGLLSWVEVPIGPEDDTCGYLSLRSKEKAAYGTREVKWVAEVAKLLASPIRNSHLIADLRDEAEIRERLASIGELASSSTNLDSEFSNIATEISNLVSADRIVVRYLDEGQKSSTVAHVWGLELPGWGVGDSHDFQELPSSIVRNRPEGYFACDTTDAEMFTSQHLRLGLRSVMCVPLISRDRLIGTLNLMSTMLNAYNDKDLRVLRLMGDQIAGSVAAHQHLIEMEAAARIREQSLLLDAENRRLEAENEFKSSLLSTVSHELRTPLTSISAFADLLSRNKTHNLTERQLDHVGLIQKSSSLLFFLINDLLAATTIESGNFDLTIELLAAEDLIREAESAVEPLLREKLQQLVIESNFSSHSIWVDRIRLLQILTNLLSNASKYSDENTTITLSAKACENSFEFVIRDEGAGISKDDQQRLFETYFRSDDRATRSRQGTGLGLYIAKSLTELHGGVISVKSELGAGTSFTVSIPNQQIGEQS